MSGSQDNFETLFDDLQEVIEFIGNNLTKNISLYCKGEISSLVGLWLNVYFPFLFNTTVLHVEIIIYRMVFTIFKTEFLSKGLIISLEIWILKMYYSRRVDRECSRD